MRAYKHSIHTLDPAQLTKADLLDLSNLVCPQIHLYISPTHQCIVNFYYSNYTQRDRFPDGARGVLYYHMPIQTRPLAGEIRFRLVHGAAPLEFHNGCDLLLPNGLPWSLPIITLSRSQRSGFFELLLRDGLLDKNHLDWLSRLGENWQSYGKPHIIIHELDQAFLHDFSRSRVTCNFIGETSLSRGFAFTSPFVRQSNKAPLLVPFSGVLQPSCVNIYH